MNIQHLKTLIAIHERASFADIGQTLADFFALDAMAYGDSFFNKIN